MNEISLVEKKKSDVSDRYRLMADRIDHNADAAFGGSCVIIPPPGGGDPIEFILLDLKSDPAQFWATITSKIQILLKELEMRQGQPFAGMNQRR